MRIAKGALLTALLCGVAHGEPTILCSATAEDRNTTSLIHLTKSTDGDFDFEFYGQPLGLPGLAGWLEGEGKLDPKREYLGDFRFVGERVGSAACDFPGKKGAASACKLHLTFFRAEVREKETGKVNSVWMPLDRVEINLAPHPEDPEKVRLAYVRWFWGPMYRLDRISVTSCFLPEP